MDELEHFTSMKLPAQCVPSLLLNCAALRCSYIAILGVHRKPPLSQDTISRSRAALASLPVRWAPLPAKGINSGPGSQSVVINNDRCMFCNYTMCPSCRWPMNRRRHYILVSGKISTLLHAEVLQDGHSLLPNIRPLAGSGGSEEYPEVMPRTHKYRSLQAMSGSAGRV
jgi:sulfite reductase beta subunit